MNGIDKLHSNEAGVGGIRPDALVTVVDVQRLGLGAVTMIQEAPPSKVANELRHQAQYGRGSRSVAGWPQVFPRRHTSEFGELA